MKFPFPFFTGFTISIMIHLSLLFLNFERESLSSDRLFQKGRTSIRAEIKRLVSKKTEAKTAKRKSAPRPPSPTLEQGAKEEVLSESILPAPKYPFRSRVLGEEGEVTLKVKVSTDGIVYSVEITKSSGFPRLDKAAKASLLSKKFSTATKEEVVKTITINFRLET